MSGHHELTIAGGLVLGVLTALGLIKGFQLWRHRGGR
jgi:hypothetical protein